MAQLHRNISQLYRFTFIASIYIKYIMSKNRTLLYKKNKMKKRFLTIESVVTKQHEENDIAK